MLQLALIHSYSLTQQLELHILPLLRVAQFGGRIIAKTFHQGATWHVL